MTIKKKDNRLSADEALSQARQVYQFINTGSIPEFINNAVTVAIEDAGRLKGKPTPDYLESDEEVINLLAALFRETKMLHYRELRRGLRNDAAEATRSQPGVLEPNNHEAEAAQLALIVEQGTGNFAEFVRDVVAEIASKMGFIWTNEHGEVRSITSDHSPHLADVAQHGRRRRGDPHST